MIETLPFPDVELDWSRPTDVEFAAWEIADGIVEYAEFGDIAPAIVQFYAFGRYCGEVENGGHSQLIHNLAVDSRFWVLGATWRLAQQIGCSGLETILCDLRDWLVMNAEEAKQQTGFEGGRAEALDELDARYFEIDEASRDHLTFMLGDGADQDEETYLRGVLDGTAESRSHLLAMRTLWLKRSGSIQPMPDDEVTAFFEVLKRGRV